MWRFLDHYLGTLVPFLDHFVAGGGSYDAPPVRWMLAHDSWRDSAAWPPENSAPVDWFLQGRDGSRSGALTSAADAAERLVSWPHDPLDPVPSLAHAYHPLIEPADETASRHRNDLLVYETEPVRAPLDLAGPATLTLTLTSDVDATHLMATVSDLSPDGSALKILDGAVRATGPWPREVTVDLGSTGYRLRPGHRLRLALGSSEFPRYLVHPGTASDPWTARTFRRTEQQTMLGGPRSARLRCFALRTRGGRA
jgi:putative CocE/NonD family hydrolase